MKPSNPFRIGSGVVISAGAMVLAGAEIGDGAVIGAGAVVTKPVQPFGIYAGVPAKKLRSRQTFAPWWDFSIPVHAGKSAGAERDRLRPKRLSRLPRGAA
ncbi:hypothetical protein [Caulobacter segnis]